MAATAHRNDTLWTTTYLYEVVDKDIAPKANLKSFKLVGYDGEGTKRQWQDDCCEQLLHRVERHSGLIASPLHCRGRALCNPVTFTPRLFRVVECSHGQRIGLAFVRTATAIYMVGGTPSPLRNRVEFTMLLL